MPTTLGFGDPVSDRDLPDHVVERLVTGIALGMYVPGQRLPAERDLAVMLGVSRPTLREALRRLTDAGYLEQRRGRAGGSFVLEDWRPESASVIRGYLEDNLTRLEALFDARALIEPAIAATAAERRTAAEGRAIAAAAKAYETAPDREASRAADQLLHRRVAECTHNPVLVELSAEIRSKVSLGLGAEPYTGKIRIRAIGQHQELVDAILDRDSDRAARIAGIHFRLTEDLVRGLVKRVRGARS